MMTAMQLTLPRAFMMDDSRTDALVTALRRHLDVADPMFSMKKAVTLPVDYIELVGDWKLWATVFGVPVGAFFARFGYRLADDTYDATRDWLRGEEAEPLAGVSTILANAAKVPETKTNIVIGLNVPHERNGTVLVIQETEPAQIAHAIARFVIACEDITTAVTAEVASRKRFAGPATIKLADDGSVLVQWTDLIDFSKHEVRIARTRDVPIERD